MVSTRNLPITGRTFGLRVGTSKMLLIYPELVERRSQAPCLHRRSAALLASHAYVQTAAGASGRVITRAAAVEDTGKSLRELNSDDFYTYLEEAGDRLVVVDFYTDWCGPCKVMLPILEDLAQELQGKVDIVKFNCNAKNKELGKTLKIRVAPTFHIYKNSNKVAEMTGAKIDELKSLIDQQL